VASNQLTIFIRAERMFNVNQEAILGLIALTVINLVNFELLSGAKI
jgi:hypothetical protein